MTDIVLPEHLRRFPCMQPWIGSRYRDERHKRLLVVGEPLSAARVGHPPQPRSLVPE